MQHNVSLKPFNTFGFTVTAKYLAHVTNIEQLADIVQFANKNNLPYLVIGSGSNVIFTGDFAGIITHLDTNKITINGTQITAEAGVNWHYLVQFSLANQLYGLENLALIPGTVGASPVQNIGAYGAQFADFCSHIKVFDTKNMQTYDLEADKCAFAYRDSIFKQYPNRWIILNVSLNLHKKFIANLSYTPLKQHLAHQPITALKIFNAICEIRNNKLPNPTILGNAGSFFKNPVVTANIKTELQAKYNAIPIYKQADNSYKIAAAWLIEQCGLKGYRLGDAAVYQHQPLVLVNYGAATAQEILDLANIIQNKVRAKFGISLDIEPIII